MCISKRFNITTHFHIYASIQSKTTRRRWAHTHPHHDENAKQVRMETAHKSEDKKAAEDFKKWGARWMEEMMLLLLPLHVKYS